MATVTDPPPSATNQPAVSERDPVRETRQRATAAQPPPGQERAFSWGDGFAVQVWFACCVLLWLVLVADFLFGMLGR
jgi:hypothetical protein